MAAKLEFNRMEWAGSLGDLGTLLPLSLGMIMINNLDPVGVFFGVGLFYIFSGLYFRVTSPVEPMKVVSGYAIASGVGAASIQAASFWLFAILLFIGLTGVIDWISRHTGRPVVRGIQLSTGMLLMTKGVELILGTSGFQGAQNQAEPYLRLQQLGPLPIGIIIGLALGILALLLINNRRFPAALVVVGAGIATGILLGVHDGWETIGIGVHLPRLLPHGMPAMDMFSFALVVLVLPQIPMTIGNAVIANADLSRSYFPEQAGRVTHRALCVSMACANLGSFLIGGMPMCHGAGGLASRYRFGARTGGSNLIIGGIFLVFVILFGSRILSIVTLLPFSALGILLLFAGIQLALTIGDIGKREDLFVVVLIAGVTMASNLALGFIVGLAVSLLMKRGRLSI